MVTPATLGRVSTHAVPRVADRRRHVRSAVSWDSAGSSGRRYGYFDAHHDCGYLRSYADYLATGEFTCEDRTYPHVQAGAPDQRAVPAVAAPVAATGTIHPSRGRPPQRRRRPGRR